MKSRRIIVSSKDHTKDQKDRNSFARVVVRCRPMTDAEASEGTTVAVSEINEGKWTVSLSHPDISDHRDDQVFEFDRAYGSSATQVLNHNSPPTNCFMYEGGCIHPKHFSVCNKTYGWSSQGSVSLQRSRIWSHWFRKDGDHHLNTNMVHVVFPMVVHYAGRRGSHRTIAN